MLVAGSSFGAVASANDGPLTIVHCGDPQFGFSPDTTGEESYCRCRLAFERLVDAVNRLSPDLVCIAGDLTHDWHDVSRDWPRLLGAFRSPVLLTVGNHDLPDPASNEQRSQLEKTVGPIYKAMTVRGWRIISLNSQFERLPNPDQAYVTWRDAEIVALSKSGMPGIVLTHHPLFLSNLHEPDTGENYPLKTRIALYDKLAEAGVRYILAGHTHRIMTNAYRGVPELMPETTCNNFDGRPFGFRVLKVWPSGDYEWSFVRVSA